jgi:hypothetical protein
MIRAVPDRYRVRGWSAHRWRDATDFLLPARQEHQAEKRLAGVVPARLSTHRVSSLGWPGRRSMPHRLWIS